MTTAEGARAYETDTTPSASAEDVAAYVATMARDLNKLVSRHDLATLSYLLELIQLEATRTAGSKSDLPD